MSNFIYDFNFITRNNYSIPKFMDIRKKLKNIIILIELISIFTFYYIFIRIFCIIPFNVYAFIEIYNSHLIPRYITYSLAGLTCLYCFGNIMWSKKLVKGYNKWLKNSNW